MRQNWQYNYYMIRWRRLESVPTIVFSSQLINLPIILFLLIVSILANTQTNRRVSRQQIQTLQNNVSSTGLEQFPNKATDNGKLTLKVCCGDSESNCEEFQRPEDMFGIGCCGGHPINEFEEICCEGVTRRRRQPFSYVEGCCGNQTLAYDQTCCQGIVHNLPNGECCGSQAYPRNNINVLCCNGVLNVNVEQGLTCCGTIPYDGGLRETCCGDAVYLKELFDGCCPIYGSDPQEYRQFNSRTHQCCDVPIERSSNTKCCHLSEPGNARDRWRPKSYDSSTSCCAFPFTAIVSKNNEGTCARVTAPAKISPTNTTTPIGSTNPQTTPPTTGTNTGDQPPTDNNNNNSSASNNNAEEENGEEKEKQTDNEDEEAGNNDEEDSRF